MLGFKPQLMFEHVQLDKSYFQHVQGLCATSDGITPALPCAKCHRFGPPRTFWQEECVALAGKGQLTQEDAVKIKQCCV